MTIAEIKSLINASLPQLAGRTVLAGTSWDITASPQVEKVLTANTDLTITNSVAGKSAGLLLVTPGAFTLSIGGVAVTLNASGKTAVSVYTLLDGTFYISPDVTSTSATSTPTYVTDALSAMGAWGLRKMRTGYAGFAVKVRRASDNTTQDIGFSSTGGLDVTALNTFISGTTGFVDTLYDQSTTGKNATQTTTTAQPQLVVNSFNGLPSIKFDGVDDCLNVVGSTASFKPLHTSQGTFNAVISAGLVADPNALLVIAGNNGVASTKTGFAFYYDDRASVPRNNAFTTFTSAGSGTAALVVADTNQNVITPQTPTIVTGLLDNANATLTARSEQYINQGAMLTQTNASLNASTSNSATHDLQIGANGASAQFFAGYIAEIILVGAKISSTLKSGMLTNQSGYYNIL